MIELYNKLKNYTLEDIIKFEEQDRQFIALKKLWNNLENKNINLFLSFIIANSIICYQLSSLGEDYWEEFTGNLEKYLNNGEKNIYDFFDKFLINSKGNKRLLEIKKKRIKKLEIFFEIFQNKEKFYYNNMILLTNELSQIMNQKNIAKTIVFAIKMFGYGSRICFNKIIYFPTEINIPIDSRLEKIYKKYGNKNDDINIFYQKLSKKLDIPLLHLDVILWIKNDL